MTSTLSVWANRVQGEIVIISEKAVGEYMNAVDPGRLKLQWRVWTLELLKIINYLHEKEIAPLDLSLESLTYTSTGSLLIEDCLFSFDKSETALAVYADETCDSSEELSDLPLLDSLRVGIILLRLFLQETFPIPLSDLLVQLKTGLIAPKLDNIPDIKLRTFLACCVCDKTQRWTVQKLLQHAVLRETTESEREDLTDSLSSNSSEEELRRKQKKVKVDLVVNLNDALVKVEFEYNPKKDTPEKVSEELLSELNIPRFFLPPTISVIRRKIQEKLSKIEDLLTLSPQTQPLSMSSVGSLPVKDVKFSLIEELSVHQLGQSLQTVKGESGDVSEVGKLDQSCPMLLDMVPKVKIIPSSSEDLKAENGVFLKKGGERNEEVQVKRLQEALNVVMSCELHVDGVFSKKTEQLVKEFQERQGLEVTGVVEPGTWTALVLQYQRLQDRY